MSQNDQAGDGPLERPVRRLDDGLPADAVRFAGAPAPRIRVYRMDDNEWWAGESLVDCVAEGRRQCGDECYPDDPSEQYELSDEQMQRLVFIDESDGAEPPVRRTFAEELARRIAAGEAFPQQFAAEDW